jgi:hypothetical protein
MKSRRLFGRIMRIGPKSEGCYRMPDPESMTDDEIRFMFQETGNEFWTLLLELNQLNRAYEEQAQRDAIESLKKPEAK